ncbi:hypothetical protein [Ammoniphilus resinae]|uniref:hypothetical protein n=1 Tax=Ammoniphilus resinae TaxID=861532 RepID=UPI001AE9CA83|nr:hypothetical protein [Ammoniphilus resinae]
MKNTNMIGDIVIRPAKVYQSSRSIKEALEQLKMGCNTHFSAEVVNAFQRVLLKDEILSS